MKSDMTILLIEDSRLLRLAITKMLMKGGYAVTAVGDGEEGLRKAEQLSPSIILLDMMLPAMEGTTVLRRLKQNSVTQSIPVVVLSGLSQRNEEKLKAAGAAGYLEKSLLDFDGDGAALLNALAELRYGFKAT